MSLGNGRGNPHTKNFYTMKNTQSFVAGDGLEPPTLRE